MRPISDIDITDPDTWTPEMRTAAFQALIDQEIQALAYSGVVEHWGDLEYEAAMAAIHDSEIRDQIV